MVGQVMHNISTWRWIRSSNGWTSSGPSCIGSISPCHVAEIATWQRHRSPGHARRAPRCQWCKGKSWQERYKHHKFRNYINHNNSFLVQMLWVISRFQVLNCHFFLEGVNFNKLCFVVFTTLWLSNVLGTWGVFRWQTLPPAAGAQVRAPSAPSSCMAGMGPPRSQQPPGDDFFGWYVGVSKNRGTPKWMVYNGKPY